MSARLRVPYWPCAAIALLALGAEIATAQSLPDLVPEISDVHFEFGASVPEGDVAEGCAASTQGLDLLRLALTTRNDGPGDLLLGDPLCPNCAANPGAVCAAPSFICSPAGGHNHPHYQNFMRFELIDRYGGQVGLGGKRSFCLAESGCLGTAQTHTCSNQGLGAGCWDVYTAELGCQYIDVTVVPDGAYTLRVTIDPGGEIAEASELNNVQEQIVAISRGGEPDVALEGGAIAILPGKVLRVGARPVSGNSLPGPAADPTLGGAVLHVVDVAAGSELELPLPAPGWRARGKHAARGYRYRGDGSDADPCTSVVVGPRRLRATCRGAAIDLDLPAQGPIFVELELGAIGKRYCASFGGKAVRNTSSALKRRNPGPSTCSPVP